jgi:HAMP domain-containing protein
MEKLKVNILTKLLLLLLLLTVVPLSLLGFFAINDAKALGYQAADEAKEMGKTTLQNSRLIGDIALEGSTNALNKLGEKIIQEKARDVAKQIEVYINENPDVTILDLQNNNIIRTLATAPVGETGYNCLYECETGVMRIHPNEGLIDKDMSFLKEKLPDWWLIFEESLSCSEVSGYYNWEDADGAIREKYMTMTPVVGTKYMIAATTYIDEFNRPVLETTEKIIKAINKSEQSIIASNERTEANIKAATEGLTLQNKILFITIGTIIIVIILGIFFSRTITRPIVNLKNIANDVVDGNMNAQFSVSTTDEIKDLTIAMEALVSSLKFFRKESENSDVVKENSEEKKKE